MSETVNNHTSTLEGLNTQVNTNSSSIATLREDVDDIQLIIDGLNDNYVSKSTYLSEFGDFASMNHAVAEDSTMVDEINNLMDAMTWKTIPENE